MAWINTNNPIYITSKYWDIVWSRPYVNYEGHHKLFWQKIREASKGNILDMACGSASCWRGYNGSLVHGCDFSPEAIREARRNVPRGNFEVEEIPTHHYDGQVFTTIVLSGLINYYRDLLPIIEMLKRIDYKQIIITINVIDDFPDRHWDQKTIEETFKSLGKVEAKFYDKVGWFVILHK